MIKDPLTTIDLEKFEEYIFSGNFIEADNYFHRLLGFFSKEGGKSIPQLLVANETPGDLCHLLTRLASAIGQTVVRPDFLLLISDLDELVVCQLVLSRIFALTPLRNADYLVQHLLRPDENGIIYNQNILKAFLLFSTESKLTKLLKVSGYQNKDLYLSTCLMLIWACSGSEESCANREWAYEESTKILEESSELSLPFSFIHGFFMHSSYGFSQNKHAIKKHINNVIKQRLLSYHASILSLSSSASKVDTTGFPFEKPILLVILERFNPQHSVYRVLARSLEACKRHFTLVAVAWPNFVHQLPNNFFDVEITLSGSGENYCLGELLDIVHNYMPVGVYFPSIGMTPWTIYFSNLRLAKVQFTTVGHAASSFATEIDYFLAEEDISGNENTYSEKLIKLPIGSMPFCPPNSVEYHIKQLSCKSTLAHKKIEIVCSTNTVKLNARLLKLCRKIDEKYNSKSSKTLISFTFLIQIYSGGIDYEIYRQLILGYLPNATIHISLPFQAYLDTLAKMDIALSPFPYGNMNTLIDCSILGVVGVCMDGPQIHQAIDGGMMRRMGMPEWLIAQNEGQYENAICRLIDNESERHLIRDALVVNKRYQSFFDGDPSIFANYVKKLILG